MKRCFIHNLGLLVGKIEIFSNRFSWASRTTSSKRFVKSHQVFSCYNESKPEYGDSVKMDLLNHEMISSVLTETKPDVVIHLGAMTGVDLM